MTRSTGVRRLLAVLLCVTLIASCITVAGVAAVSGAARGFEGQTVGADLALSNPYGNTMQVSDAQAHEGSRSLLVHTGKSGGSNRPQLLMQGASGQDFKTQAGGEYQISFWYYVPGGQSTQADQLMLWVGTKGEDKTAFSAGSDSEAGSKKGHLLTLSDNNTGEITGGDKNQGLTLAVSQWDSWQYVQFTVRDEVTAAGGYLILGIAATSQSGKVYAGHEFYLDDITVSSPSAPGGDPWGSFEGQAAGTGLALSNTYGNTAQVSAAQAHGGSQSLLVHTGKSGGSNRPQLLLKDADGRDFKTQAGGEYQISFWYYVPDGQSTQADQLSLWIGTKGEEKTAFSAGSDGEAGSKKGHLLTLSDSNTGEITGDAKNQGLTLAVSQWDSWQHVQFTVRDEVTAGGGYLILGIAATSQAGKVYAGHEFYLDDITITTQSAPVDPRWGCFETAAAGTDLALANTYGNTMLVSTEQKHTGAQSLRVHTGQSGGSNRPQLLLRDADGNDFKTAAGKKYRIGFWYYVPGGQNATVDQLTLWVGTKGEEKTAFNAGSDSAAGSKKGHLLTLSGRNTGTVSGDAGNQGLTVTVSQRDSWQYVCFTAQDEVTTDGGYLILGAAATSQSGKVYAGLEFYLDDISIEAVPATTVGQGWSFENETAGANLSMNIHPMTVTDEQSYDGAQALQVVSADSSGNGRAQLIVRDENGTPVTVEAGKKYDIRFWYYIRPDDTAISGLNYWLAAADDSTPFDGSSYKKDDYKLAEPNIATAVKGQWTQAVCSIEAAYSGTLRLGISPSTNGNAAPFFLDAIRVTEAEPDGVAIPADPGATTLTFEKIPVGGGTKMLLRGGGAVDAAYNRTAGGSHALRLEKMTNAGVYRNQLVVMDPSTGKPFEMAVGKKYALTFYVYMPEDAVEEMKINYWLLSTNTLAAVEDKSAAEFDYSTASVPGATGEWMRLQSVIEVKNGKYLILGITDFGLAEGAAYYIDDMHIEERVDRGMSIDAQPGATMWDFETMPLGSGEQLQLRGIGSVDDAYNHTPGGSRSLKLQKLAQTGILRNQLVVMDQATGKPAELTIGKEYTISFWAYLPEETGDVLQLNFWLLTANELKTVDNKDAAEYDLQTSTQAIVSGEWERVEATIRVTNGKYLILGVTDLNYLPNGVYYYLDDIELRTPEYVTVRFDTNGSLETIADVEARIGAPLTMPTDPYRMGYEFTGWYRDKSCSADSLFDPEQNMTGKNGDVLTLYAGWKLFDESGQDSSPQETIRYETEYYEEWEPTQQELLEFGESSQWKPAGTVNRDQPDKNTDASDAAGIAPWLILLIIGGAVVVVGGGAVLALVLLKRKKV